MHCFLQTLFHKIVGLCEPAPKTNPTGSDSPPAVAIPHSELPSPAKVKLFTRARLPDAWVPTTPERVHAPRQASSVYSQDDCTESARRRMGRRSCLVDPSSKVNRQARLQQEVVEDPTDPSWTYRRILPPYPLTVKHHVTFDETTLRSSQPTPKPAPESAPITPEIIQEEFEALMHELDAVSARTEELLGGKKKMGPLNSFERAYLAQRVRASDFVNDE
ncbi:MAG: hypothetical protein Q9212_004451 [Teloschistes hypoglaucus]